MFCIIHNHTMYSLHDLAQTPEELVMRAKEIGVHDVSLTDHGTMLGIDDFLAAGKKYGINAVPGIEAYIANREHLVIIAKDLEGYYQISKALRDAEENRLIVRGKKYPIMSDEILERHFKGSSHVFATSACIAGPIASILLRREKIRNIIEKENSKLELLKPIYESWLKKRTVYQESAEKEKALKKEITEKKRALKKFGTAKPGKLQQALDTSSTVGKQATEYSVTATRKEALTKELEYLQEECSAVADRRRKTKKESDSLSSKAKHFLQAEHDLKNTVLPDAEDLYEEAKERLNFLKNIFLEFYLEVQYHGIHEEAAVMPLICTLSHETDTPLIAANDAHMARRGEWQGRQILRYNYFKKHQDLREEDYELYVKNESELRAALETVISHEDTDQAIANTAVLSECHVEIPHEPHYPVSGHTDDFYTLIDRAKGRLISEGRWSSKHEERLKREINVMEQMGYIDYHMVVYDYCNMIRLLSCVPQNELCHMPRNFEKVEEWIRRKGFHTGTYTPPGRGSAAGSLVCYLLGITNIDPIQYHLLFDRYLNPERVTLPDIDTDVKRSLRPYIIKYLKWKYGEHAVASICTKNSYAGRSAVRMADRDRASELNDSSYSAKYTEPVANLIPIGSAVSECDELFYQTYGSDTEKALLWERAKIVEGKLSSVGIHAGGVIISDSGDVCDYVPVVWRDEKQVWAAQCDMTQVENKGLLKMDLLGLGTQDCISDTMQLVEKYHGEVISVNDMKFEKEVFEEIFSKGFTNSVFQFESPGMKRMLREFRPENIEDLILLVAMYRPGPMQYIDGIIDVKQGKKMPEYIVDELKPILSMTYGAIVYQEQVMQIFRELAGYSYGQADLVRRAMSKKNEDKLKIERRAFLYGDEKRGIDGCEKRGISTEKADFLFDSILEFAKYAFNRSHAAAYAVVAYQTAWLKYHYPAEFYCSMFNNENMDDYGLILEDCHTSGIRVLQPDINRSYFDFVLEEGQIRYGFKGIKGIASRDEVESFTSLRSRTYTESPFQSAADFFQRSKRENGLLGKKISEALIEAGAFDCFTRNRQDLLNSYYEAAITGDMDHFEHIPNNWDKKWNRKHEMDLLGVILSEDPLKEFPDDRTIGCVPFHELAAGKCSVMGTVAKIDSKLSKKTGEPYVRLTLAGRQGTLHILLVGDRALSSEASFELGQPVKVTGEYRSDLLFAREIKPLVKDTYYLRLDTIEKTRQAAKLMEHRETGDIPLLIEFHYNASYEQIPPTLSAFHLSFKMIKTLGGMKFEELGIRKPLHH